MGNLFSSEEKLHRDRSLAGKHSGKILGLYENYGYSEINTSITTPKEHRYIKRRNLSFQGRNGRNYYYKSKSHSLNAILEELYSFDPESDIQEGRQEISGSRIPRIKLKRSTSSLKEEKNYKALRKMSSEQEIFFDDTTNLRTRVNNDVNGNIPQSTTKILINGQSCDEIPKESDESYFKKNFDDCMKCLEMIEKEYKLIENVDIDRQFCTLSQERNNAEVVENFSTHEGETVTEGEFKNIDCTPKEKLCETYEVKFENQTQSLENSETVGVGVQPNSVTSGTFKTMPLEEDVTLLEQNKEPISDWYSNLKQQFEKRERETQEGKAREMSCRITGATLKTQNEKNKSEDKEKHTRHYFSNLVKTNRSLIDEELPDPDKVKHIRAMFQETLNSTLKRKLDKKLGGSLQNISLRTAEQQMIRPLSAQCCRNEVFIETGSVQSPDEKKDVETFSKEVSIPLTDESKDFEIEKTKKKLLEKFEKDSKPGREYKNRRILQPKWTDTGSVSSGVGSDLSSYDTDFESYSREGTEQDEMTISDDDLLEEVKDKHYIQNEVLEKIRSYGTSVTYYGGEMITCSVGPLLSPTTQAIMEEIGEKYATNPVRSFDEFYRKYMETNEHTKKKKVGRTRSFGQNDVFQKPNVLSNTEIELYKNDLEIEIGIKKPAGVPQNSLKRKVTKSASLEIGMKTVEKNDESQDANSTTDNLIESTEEKVSESGFLRNESEIIRDSKTLATDSNSEQEAEKQMESNNKIVEDKCEKAATKENKEMIKSSADKEFIRSKSAPEGLSTQKKYEITLNGFESPAKEIYFSYEKSLFNGKRNSDMEFEEFEVCESLSEKLEKLEKQSSEGAILPSNANSDSQSEQTCNEDANDESNRSSNTALAEENVNGKMETNEDLAPSAAKNESSQNQKQEPKFNHSRWPIETTVMVDIQKNDELTPKIIKNRKTSAKTKVRLF